LQIKAQPAVRQQLLVDVINFEANNNNLARAQTLATQLRSEFPQSPLADQVLGEVFFRMNQLPQSIAAFESARKRGLNRNLAVGLARAYAANNQTPQAVAVMREWGKRQPTDITTNLVTSEILMNAKQFPQALAEYQLLVRRGVRNAAIFNNIAWIYNRQGDKRARIVAEEALRLAPNSAQIMDTLGWILVKQNIDVRRGLSLLERAVRELPNSPDVRFHFAVALRANGRAQQAVTELQTILQRFPQFEQRGQAQAILAAIQQRGR
jgi:tetratricopeptide (TPR) repeat protein